MPTRHPEGAARRTDAPPERRTTHRFDTVQRTAVALVEPVDVVPCAYCHLLTPPVLAVGRPWDWPGRGRVVCCYDCGGYRRCPEHGLVDEAEHPGWHWAGDSDEDCTRGERVRT